MRSAVPFGGVAINWTPFVARAKAHHPHRMVRNIDFCRGVVRYRRRSYLAGGTTGAYAPGVADSNEAGVADPKAAWKELS